MEATFWHKRWKNNQIGFHLSHVNPLLMKFWSKLNTHQIGTVFVPLCGKSHDLIWLTKNATHVLGNELSEKAVSEFISEQQLSFQHEADSDMYQSQEITLIARDFFQLTQQDLKEVTHIYDRASLIALPKSMRQDYVDHLMSQLTHQVQILLITLDYDQTEQNGPPFAVSESEVHQLYATYFNIQCLDEQDQLAEWQAKGRNLSRFDERVYLLTPKRC